MSFYTCKPPSRSPGLEWARVSYVFPTEYRVAVDAIDIDHSVQACDEDAILLGSREDIHAVVPQYNASNVTR